MITYGFRSFERERERENEGHWTAKKVITYTALDVTRVLHTRTHAFDNVETGVFSSVCIGYEI